MEQTTRKQNVMVKSTFLPHIDSCGTDPLLSIFIRDAKGDDHQEDRRESLVFKDHHAGPVHFGWFLKDYCQDDSCSGRCRHVCRLQCRAQAYLIGLSSEEKELELVPVEDETTEEMQLALEAVKAQRSAVTEAILESLEETTMGKSWHHALEAEFSKAYFTKVC